MTDIQEPLPSLQADTDTSHPLETFLCNQFGDRYLHSVNHNAFNKIGSDNVYRQRWGESIRNENTLYIVAGCDSGIFIQYIKKHGIPNGSRYLIVELPELIPLMESMLDEQDIDNKLISLCSVDDWLVKAKSCYFQEHAYLDTIRLVKSIAVEDAYLPQYSQLWQQLEQEYKRIIWQYRVELGNFNFILRQIENLAENRYSAYHFKDAFKGKTAVLLAGGPSLDDLLPWVKSQRDNLILVSVSRICKRLQQLDIEPDIIVSVDPYHYSFDVSKHMLNFEKAVFVSLSHACPLLVGQWRGRSAYMQSRYPWNVKHDDKKIFGRGPTVSNSAIDLMMAIGFSQIVLAGLDLCFTEEGFSHAQGSDERKVGARVSYGGQFIKTNAGNTAETDNSFFNAITSIKIQAKEALEKDCQFINPSPSAAAIENVKHISVDEITVPSLDKPAAEIINDCLPEETRESRITIYQETLQEVTRALHKLGKLKQLVKNALAHNDGLFGKNGKQRDFKHKIKMDRIEKQIQKEYPDFGNLSKHFGATAFTKILRPGDSEDWTDDEIEQAGRAYYEAYLEGSSKLMQAIEQQKQRLMSRLEEEQERPDFEMLFKQWQADNQPGRALVWTKHHPDEFETLSQDIKGRFSRFEQQFLDELENSDHSYMVKINEFASLDGVISKARQQHNSKDIAGLQRLLKGLASRSEPKAKQLYTLVKGYLAETENRIDDAISAYKLIVENEENWQSRIMEDPLTRLVVLMMSKQDHNHALVYLNMLAQISPNFMPHYADMLRITNDLQGAIDVYTEYLAVAPNDLAAMMKLGMLYHKLGVKDGASYIFNHVLEQDPHNEAARTMLHQLTA